MPKFIIKWDIGFGPNAEVIEAENIQAASDAAYAAAREDFENQVDYRAIEYSDDEAENYDLVSN